MSSPSPPPLPIPRSSRKQRSTSPHPNSAASSHSRSRSQSRPLPSPVPTSVLRQPSTASSNASSATYVDPPPAPSWRQRSREARNADLSPTILSDPAYPPDRDAYTPSSRYREPNMPPPPSRNQKVTTDERSARAYMQSREPPRFIVQSPSTSSMDRESNHTSWSQLSARDSRGYKKRPSEAIQQNNQAHIRTSSTSGGLRSPADLANPCQRSSSRTPSRRRDASASPQVTPTLPPPSPTFDYSRSESPQLSPNLQTLSPASGHSPHSAGSASPDAFSYDEYSRTPPPPEAARNTTVRDGRCARTRSGTIAVPSQSQDTRQSESASRHSRKRSVTPSALDAEWAPASQAPHTEDQKWSKSSMKSSQIADPAPTSRPPPPIPPRHPSLVSPTITQGAGAPPLPPRRPSPVITPSATIVGEPEVQAAAPRHERKKSKALQGDDVARDRTGKRERTMSSRGAMPLQAIPAEEVSTGLPYAVPAESVSEEVERVKRDRTTTWTAGQAFESSVNHTVELEVAEIPSSQDARKRERTRSAGAEKENTRPGRERTRSAATTMNTRIEGQGQDATMSKRSRTKSGGAVLQESNRRDTVSDDTHAILMGQMPESPEEARSARQTPRRQSSRGSVSHKAGDDEDDIARNRAEALAALSAPNTPKTKGTPGKKSRPTTATEVLRPSESGKLKGLGMNIAFPPDDIPPRRETLGRNNLQNLDQSLQSLQGRAPSPTPDYSHLFAALADPYTPPVPEEFGVESHERVGDTIAPDQYDSDDTDEDHEEEVVWDGRDQEIKPVEEPDFQFSPQVSDLQRKSSTLRPPTLKKVLTSSTSVSSLAWSGDEEVEKGINSAASKLLAGLHDVPEEPEGFDDRDQSQPYDVANGNGENRTPTMEDLTNEHIALREGRNTPAGPQQKTWRSTLSSTATYQSLLDRYGAVEMHRQELIFELTTTESTFVHDMRLVIRLFIQPLRDRAQPPTWIPGVPADVGRLFDWLDDIVQLHAEFARVLHSARQSQYPVVLLCAGVLRPLVAKLEVHQPYLVRLNEVSRTIDNMMKQPESDFGEFLRMQSVSDEWDGLSLSSWLLKPVQRLTKYALFFKHILESTPRSHPDHIPSLSLYYTTDTVIRVMQEVKAREEEYDMVKMLASRMAGVPRHIALGERGRRLLAQGPLLRLEGGQRSSGESEARPNRSTGRDRGRSGLYNPRLSMQSINHSDGSSYEWPSTPSLGVPDSPYSSADGMSATRTPSPNRGDYFGRTLSRPGSVRSVSSEERVYETSIYAFVFSDVVVLGTPLSERNPLLQNTRRSKRAPQWQLLSDVGLCHVLAYNQHSDKFGFEFVLRVDLLPCMTDEASEARTSTTVFLTLPDNASSDKSSLETMKKIWANAFESSMHHALRSLSFPSIEPFTFPMELEAQVGSPLSPSFPRSPSAIAQHNTGPVETERGEREWWSHRFQQVAAEFMRDRNFRANIVEVQVAPEHAPRATKDRSSRRKRMSIMHRGGPAPLELASAATTNGKVGEPGSVTPRSDNQGGLLRLLSRRGR